MIPINSLRTTTAASPMTLDESPRLPVPDLPPRILMDIQGGYCNLKCPKCFVHGPDDDERLKSVRGRMSLEDARKVLDEVMHVKPLFQPNLWTEPLMAKHFREHIGQMKERGIPVVLNTNGLLLTDDMAQFFVDIRLDAVFVSIDATTAETLMASRGTDKLAKIEEAVHRMLRVRGRSPLPRVGVSFTAEECNRHEVEAFVAHWIRHVDVVRVGEIYQEHLGTISGQPLGERVPCASLYNTLPIQFNGNAVICCLDGWGATNMGNVLADGVKAVWHGRAFQEARYFHETGQYDKVPFCRDCDVWASYKYEEVVRDGLLIRRSPLMTYYNRLDRQDNWAKR
jgi:MoaA/NifB/PqqE/SkfB family radical SAM enzyme